MSIHHEGTFMSEDYTEPVLLDDVEPKPPPRCPSCGNVMPYRGGTYGFICCGWKLLYRAGGWLDAAGLPVRDRRIRDL